jgi:hypothetical protein
MFDIITSRLRARGVKNQISISGRDKILVFSLLHSVQFGSATHLAFYSMGIVGSFFEVKVTGA